MIFEKQVSFRFLRETRCKFQNNTAKFDRSSKSVLTNKVLQILLGDREIDLSLWSPNRNLASRLWFFTTQLYFLLSSSFFRTGWNRFMSATYILVFKISTVVKIVREFRSFNHSSCTVPFVDPRGILEIYFYLYLLALNQHPRHPQLSNELYI
jgi:hypothetical protein